MTRERLPQDRSGITTRRVICSFKCYITLNFYIDSNKPAELFIDISKHGSIVSGLIDTWATTLSIAFQNGIEWSSIRSKFIGRRFDPISDEDTSIIDGIAKTIDELILLRKEYLDGKST
jgi:ribonucleoside-diphosphate reductase alpha chain